MVGKLKPLDLYGSLDNLNFDELSLNYINDAALGATYTLPVNVTNLKPYRYSIECFDARGAFIGSTLKLAQVQFDQTSPPSARRLAWVDGVPVNDTSMTARINGTTTITVPQYSGSLLGTIHVNTGAAGSLTAHFSQGPNRAFDVWNYWNRKHITLRSNAPGTVTTPVAPFYNLTSQTFTPCDQGAGMSLQTLVGIADQPVNIIMKRVFTLNAQSLPIGVNAGIAIDNTTAFSGDEISNNLDVAGATAGQVIGFNSPASVTLTPYAGIHTATCIEQVNNGGGTASMFSTNRLSVLRADWDG
jgi:hypothetical protein